MERKQFTFYESFYKAAQRLRATGTRCRFYDIVCQYALFECVPELDKLPDSVALAFELVRPHLDTSRRKALNGRRGGQGEAKAEADGKQTQADEKQTQADGKQTQSKGENKLESEPKYKSKYKSESEYEYERQVREDMERIRRLMAKQKGEEET